jgi:hypothetical protein
MPKQKIIIFSLILVGIFGSAVYWFYATNKATIVKIKYQGIEGLAVLSKKDMNKLGDGLQRWRQKRLFHLNLLNNYPISIDSVRSKIKTEFNGLEQKLEAVVEVSKSIWKKYAEGDTIRIKYLREDSINYVLVLN